MSELQALIDASKVESFTDPSKASDTEMLGILVARHCEWTGIEILKVAVEALQDANFHTMACAIEEGIESIENNPQDDASVETRQLLQSALDSLK
ncbi:MAG: hypothetical protein AMS21_02075 [Gemmatimonas sp. SG8_38_2]|nr:MAG: hypothetical protein AMS21_02075 [Gemmatimonas sp. SG8_38_2]